jgi:hypothetical protein
LHLPFPALSEGAHFEIAKNISAVGVAGLFIHGFAEIVGDEFLILNFQETVGADAPDDSPGPVYDADASMNFETLVNDPRITFAQPSLLSTQGCRYEHYKGGKQK